MIMHTTIFFLLITELIPNIIGLGEFNDIDNNNEINSRIKRQMKRNISALWHSPINYNFERRIDAEWLRKIILDIEFNTCIRFTKVQSLREVSGMFFRYSGICSSQVGRKVHHEWQDVFLGGRECSTKLLYVQQVLRTLGMYYEQNRYDRNSYVKVFFENIRPAFKDVFFMLPPKQLTTYGLPYDYGSIMHVDIYAHSRNNNFTIVPLDYLYAKTLGSSTSPTFIDYKLLNLHYCKRHCYNKLKCLNFGYPNFNSCVDCKCIKGFEGPRCERYQKPLHPTCGGTLLKADNTLKKLKINGAKKCIYHILTKSSERIVFSIKANMKPTLKHICHSHNNLEVKYYKDKSVTGARICGTSHIENTMSKNNHIIIYYKSQDPWNKVSITYKAESKYSRRYKPVSCLLCMFNKRKYSQIEK
uniref:Metalloendopeptidase n=1 Tax=Strongyloides papillosus TaxID=174720 RepID=A0A0N5C3C6_STREA